MSIPWNRVKIIATAGPSCSSYKMMKRLILSGLDIVRVNFSHGKHSEHAAVIRTVRRIESEIKRPIGILADVPGPKLRIRNLSDNIPVKNGTVFALKTENFSHREIVGALRVGSAIFLSDGKVKLVVLKAGKNTTICRALNDGEVKNGAGLNFPDIELPVAPVTKEDYQHIAFAASQGVDFLGLSFIKDASDVLRVRKFLKRKKKHMFIISKIERPLAVKNLGEIVSASDGIMVARGDLGVEMPVENIAVTQKAIIKICNAAGKPVITATQMLESMIENPSPTRAEVSDIANAILDGTDAIMLSGETAVGKYPVQAVEMMVKTSKIMEGESGFNTKGLCSSTPEAADIVASSVSTISQLYGTKAVIIPTVSGSTARRISKYRPFAMIIALTVDKRVLRELTLSWGVFPVLTEKYKNTQAVLHKVDNFVKKSPLFKKKDKVIIATGSFDKAHRMSNLIKITEV
ncbi:MAG: pyruvate kinase [Candidatus Firestonebacteria bacterium]